MRFGFIGVGNIAGAVVEGFGTSRLDNLVMNLSPRTRERSEHLAKKFSNARRLDSNQHVLDESDTLFVALRPHDSQEILSTLKFRKDHTVISFVPTLHSSDLATAVEPASRVCRAIPLPTVVNHNCPIPLFGASETIISIFNHIGQPFLVDSERRLHTFWTLTGFIASFYDLLGELGQWATSNGVDETSANRYLVDMFQSVLFAAQNTDPIDLSELARRAATPNGMNEQAAREVRENDAHKAYAIAADSLFERFAKRI